VYNITIKQLMLPNIKMWDVDKINSLFPREVALDIVAVPLLDVVKEDRLVWKEEKDGLYSVRSGYRKFLKEKGRGVGGDSIDGWSSLWKIHAPPKAKHLLWRICRECLPTRSRLINRFVPCPVECPLCLNNDEEESHLFFNCDSIREAWHVMGLANIIQSRSHLLTNVRDLICDICRNEPKMEAGKVAVLLWFAWQNRNNKVWNDACLQGLQIGYQAMQYWTQWATVQGLLHEQQQQEHHEQAVFSLPLWQQPPHGYYKCNVDASFYNLAASTGWGWVLRDAHGGFILAGSNTLPTTFNVIEGEALALMEAMKEVIQRGFHFVIFESDSKIVVDAIHSRQSGVSEFSLLISSIQSLLSLHNYFEVKYVRRQANKVAHYLARAAFSMSRRHVFDSVPPCIETYLNNEIC
jgi:ribonuclease HI